jgi:hypothetical protein
MSKHWLIQNASFEPFLKLSTQKPWEAHATHLLQFTQVAVPTPIENGWAWYLTPQHVHILYGLLDADADYAIQEIPQEKKWHDLLDEDQMDLLHRDGRVVLGYLVGERNGDVLKINWVQSFVRQRGVMREMLDRISLQAGGTHFYPNELRKASTLNKFIWGKFGFGYDGIEDEI